MRKTFGAKLGEGHISLREATHMLGISYPVARRLANEGKLRIVMVGKMRKVTVSEIARFLEEGNYVPPPELPPGLEVMAPGSSFKKDQPRPQTPTELNKIPPYLQGVRRTR